MLPILENVNSTKRSHPKQQACICKVSSIAKYEAKKYEIVNEKDKTELCLHVSSIQKTEEPTDTTSDTCGGTRTILLHHVEQDQENKNGASTEILSSKKNCDKVISRVSRNKDNTLRDDSVSPKGNLLHNGDICNLSSSKDDDISLQSSPNNTRTKDQSIQTEFGIFLDNDGENDEVGFFRFDNREFGASLRIRNQRRRPEMPVSLSLPHIHDYSPNTNNYYKERYEANFQSNILRCQHFSRESSTKEKDKKCGIVLHKYGHSDGNDSYGHSNVIENKNTDETIIESNCEVLTSPKCLETKTKKTKLTICDSFTQETERGHKPLVVQPPLKNKELTSILKDSEMAAEAPILVKVNQAPPKDQQKLVQDMRRTLGPNFATMGLIMAARSQVDCFTTQIGITDPEACDNAQDDDENNSYFFQEIYTPFMEVLIKGNSGMAKINDHARTVPPCERCFFCLLILVTLIYGIGILTAVFLLSSMMWYT